ncbi:MAG: exodeoxyribonuclease VII large subunit [Gemmataceae bacterium]
MAHAICRSATSVVTGIGHEDDLTIADLVADQRARRWRRPNASSPTALSLASFDAASARLRILGRQRCTPALS